jgi:uncharacterized protein
MIERRFVRTAEVRATREGHIDGHAAVFNQEYVLFEDGNCKVREIVKRGAFARALREKQDVVCLFNHSADQVLGRSSAGTLVMKEHDAGLYFDCTPPDTQLGRDLPVLIKRRDVKGCSFAFQVSKETITEQKIGSKMVRTRQIEEVSPLYDVGPVTYPAYTGTDVDARAMELRSLMFPQGVPATILRLAPSFAAGRARRDLDDQDEMAMLEYIDERLARAGLIQRPVS